MPEGYLDHGAVPLSPAVALGSLDELLDFPFGQMLARSKRSIWSPRRRNCPFFFCWRYQLETRFRHVISLPMNLTVRSIRGIRAVTETIQRNFDSLLGARLNLYCSPL